MPQRLLVNASKIIGQCLKDYRDEHAEIVHNNSHILADVKRPLNPTQRLIHLIG